MSSPAAFFDSLFLSAALTDVIGGFARPELHLFSYAACLASLSDGRPAAEWDYEFISAANGLPFSREIDDAIDEAYAAGFVRQRESLFVIVEHGYAELATLREMELNRGREQYLSASADCLLMFSPGNVREAFHYDPTLSYLSDSVRTDWLLGEADVERLYANLGDVRNAIATETKDLSVLLVTWLRYLIQAGRSLQHVGP